MKPTSGSVRFPILGFRINETLDELSELARHRCNAHDLSHVLCCMDICSRFDPVDWIPAPAVITAGGRYTTHVILNLILLISRDAIHFGCCRYTHRSVVFLQADDWNQLGLRGEHRCSKDDSPRYLPSGYKYATSLCTSFGNNVVFI